MFFSVITKNLNWELSTKNLVTFKRWDGVKDEKFNGSSLKNPIFRGELPKQWGFAKKMGLMFFELGLRPQCTL